MCRSQRVWSLRVEGPKATGSHWPLPRGRAAGDQGTEATSCFCPGPRLPQCPVFSFIHSRAV